VRLRLLAEMRPAPEIKAINPEISSKSTFTPVAASFGVVPVAGAAAGDDEGPILNFWLMGSLVSHRHQRYPGR
jgi:hypothetical protein